EIDDCGADHHLAVELEAAQLLPRQPRPQRLFRLGRPTPHGARHLLQPLAPRFGDVPRRARRSILALGRAAKREGPAFTHPTLPSSEIPSSFCASTANSIGNCCSTSLAKPL